MNKEIQEYWVTDTGEWGSNDVETIVFEGHHADIYESFELVSDWQLPAWAAFLAKRPHASMDLDGHGCLSCAVLSDEFRDGLK
jgi:hypothetical protein